MSDFGEAPFFHLFSVSPFERPNDPTLGPKRTKIVPKAPKTLPNDSQIDPKITQNRHFVENRKCHEKHGRAYTLATCSPPLLATLATGTACQTGVADFCPLFLRFGSPFWDLMGPGARKLRKWTPGGGSMKSLFRPFFINFRFWAPWAPRGVPEGRFYPFFIDF